MAGVCAAIDRIRRMAGDPFAHSAAPYDGDLRYRGRPLTGDTSGSAWRPRRSGGATET